MHITCLNLCKILVKHLCHWRTSDVGALTWESALCKIATCVFRICKINIRDNIYYAAISLFRKTFIFTTVTSFHVENRNMKTLRTYDAKTRVCITKNEDSITPAVGAKGDVTYSENANESGTIAITLMSTSSSLSYLRELEAKRRAINVTISDVNDADAFTLSADNCRVMKMPDLTRNKEQSTITVNIYAPSVVPR